MASTPPRTIHVLLVHGLWMPAISTARLAVRLRAAGFDPRRIGYHSILGGTATALERLAARLRGGPPVHVIGHSLGGLLALEALRAEPALPVARIVCLGTPLCGSGVAQAMSRHAVTTAYLGRSAALLRSGCAPLPEGIEVGMVAGDRPRGLGALVARFTGAHDGTVAVDETRAPNLADHVVIDASHTGLLFSAEAARQAIGFLRDGCFPH